METLTVKLKAVSNPDHGEFWGARTKTVKVGSLEEASKLCSQFISNNDLGAGNWAGGQVFSGKKQVAQISYNGRIWEV